MEVEHPQRQSTSAPHQYHRQQSQPSGDDVIDRPTPARNRFRKQSTHSAPKRPVTSDTDSFTFGEILQEIYNADSRWEKLNTSIFTIFMAIISITAFILTIAVAVSYDQIRQVIGISVVIIVSVSCIVLIVLLLDSLKLCRQALTDFSTAIKEYNRVAHEAMTARRILRSIENGETPDTTLANWPLLTRKDRASLIMELYSISPDELQKILKDTHLDVAKMTSDEVMKLGLYIWNY